MKFFSNLSKTSIIMLAAVGAVSFIFLVIGLLVIYLIYSFEKPLPFIAGITVGCIHSILKVVLLEKSINQTLDMEKERASAFARLQSVVRYVLTITVFVIVILFPNIFGLFGTILGVLSLQFAAYITNLVLTKL